MNLKKLLYLPLFFISFNSCSFQWNNSKKELKSVYINEKENTSYSDFSAEDLERVLCIAEKDYLSVIKELKTPLETAIYCTKFLKHGGEDYDLRVYGEKDYWASFRRVHENREDDCDGGAVAAAAILSDDGFPPEMLIIRNSANSHVVFIYENQHHKYGSLGINGSDCNLPVEDSIESLAQKIGKSVGFSNDIKYDIIYLGDLFPDFIGNAVNNDPN